MTIKLFTRQKLNFLAGAVLCLVFYIVAVTSYTLWANKTHRRIIEDHIDQKMIIAAKALRFMLEPYFHDRATGPSSITYAEELHNRHAISGFAEDSGFIYLYTLVEKDGRFYFSAPTVTAKEANERRVWYYYPYDDLPSGFRKAYMEKKTVFVNYSDQWGNFRSVAIPQYSPGGRLYLACADYRISDLNYLLKKNIINSILTALFFLGCSIPVIVLFSRGFSAYSKYLKKTNEELKQSKENLEKIVEERTENLRVANKLLQNELHERKIIEDILQEEKDKLTEALANVKTLSGLLPICSSCKKIRDDSGYWNQLEVYLHEHSEAEFSHGLCPDCAKKLYPNIGIDYSKYGVKNK